MKNLANTRTLFLILIMLFLKIDFLKAQSYIPLLDSAKQWNVTENYYAARTKTIFLTISSNDTLINNILYNKIIWQDGLLHNNDIFGFIREDTTNKRVYGIKQGETEEFLMYDFSLEVGDTIESDISYYCKNSFTVQSIDTITLLNNETRRKWTLIESIDLYRKLEWIEGIGNLDILMYPTHCIPSSPHAATYELLCYYENGNQLYKHAVYDTCYIDWVSSVDNNEDDLIEINVYPNPVRDILNVDLDFETDYTTNFRISLFDIFGKMVKETTTDNKKFSINMSEFPNGMYQLKIETAKQQAYIKIIKN